MRGWSPGCNSTGTGEPSSLTGERAEPGGEIICACAKRRVKYGPNKADAARR